MTPKPRRVEEGVYKVELSLPKSLEQERTRFELILLQAQRRIVNFAKLHGWKKLIQESFFDHTVICDTKSAFDKVLAKTAGLPGQEFPKTYSAALENRVLIAVSPDVYAANYPEGVEQDSYEKLLAHEIAHRLHIKILKGNEDAMGPIWFFEGFAIYAADQFSQTLSNLEPAELQTIISQTERMSYKKYGALFRYLTSKIPVEELVAHAGKSDFESWLQETIRSGV